MFIFHIKLCQDNAEIDVEQFLPPIVTMLLVHNKCHWCNVSSNLALSICKSVCEPIFEVQLPYSFKVHEEWNMKILIFDSELLTQKSESMYMPTWHQWFFLLVGDGTYPALLILLLSFLFENIDISCFVIQIWVTFWSVLTSYVVQTPNPLLSIDCMKLTWLIDLVWN